MNSAKNLHKNCVATGLSGNAIAAKAAQHGGFSQKSWSNLTRDDFVPGEHGNIGLNKLDVLSKVLDMSPIALISDPNSSAENVNIIELETSLKKSISVLHEVDVIDQNTYESFLNVIELLAAAQHAALTERNSNTSKGIVSRIVGLLAGKAGLSR